MAHEFESGFYTQRPAWHGLGTVLKDAPTIEEALIKSGTDWEVIEKPLYADLGQVYGNDNREDDLVLASRIPSHKAIVRATDNSILGIVGENYRPVQNREAFQWFDFLLDSGDATLEAGGSLRNGQRIWVLAKMKDGDGDVLKNDPVASYMLLSNAHDGSMGVWLMFTPIRVVCMNTLSAALGGAENAAKAGKAMSLRHTTNILDQMEMAKGLVNTAKRTFEDSLETYKAFAKKRITDKMFDEFFKKSYWSEQELRLHDEGTIEKSRVYATVKRLYESGTGQDIPGARGTLWAAYNAVTEFVDHERGRDDNRLSSSWFGSGNDLRSKAFKQAVKML